jgi:lysine/arginine/ornithine transport system substrate-binding protein
MKRSRLVAIVAAAVLSGGGFWIAAASGAPSNGPPVEHLNDDPASGAPYSDAVRVGPTLYLAGNLGLDTSGSLVPGGITPEADQALQNLKRVLERNGSALDRVANCEVMLADIKEREAFNEVYKKYWAPGEFPARHAFGVTGLYLGARVEIACIAAVK